MPIWLTSRDKCCLKPLAHRIRPLPLLRLWGPNPVWQYEGLVPSLGSPTSSLRHTCKQVPQGFPCRGIPGGFSCSAAWNMCLVNLLQGDSQGLWLQAQSGESMGFPWVPHKSRPGTQGHCPTKTGPWRPDSIGLGWLESVFSPGLLACPWHKQTDI